MAGMKLNRAWTVGILQDALITCDIRIGFHDHPVEQVLLPLLYI